MTYTRDPVFGCLLFVGRLDRDGYGRIGRSYAHRVAYENAYGPIPKGMMVEHLCRRRNCLSPAHLEVVNQNENELRKSWRYRAKRTTCKNDHSLSDAMVTPEGGRVCRSCSKESR